MNRHNESFVQLLSHQFESQRIKHQQKPYR